MTVKINCERSIIYQWIRREEFYIAMRFQEDTRHPAGGQRKNGKETKTGVSY